MHDCSAAATSFGADETIFYWFLPFCEDTHLENIQSAPPLWVRQVS